ncbi:MAG: hypothetical protein LBV01_02900, partial [Deltaproteobacteria bacterium]|nr:hypothetical protein [Deltaproteobacteria bacterium]
MARIKPTISLRNDRAGRNKRKRQALPVPARAKRSVWRGVDWGRVRLWTVSLAFAGLWLLLWA